MAGTKNYENWKQKNYSLKKTKIKNSALALELEQECRKNGFLTYSQFIEIDQFGKNGFHTRNKAHGETEAHKRWGKALAVLLKQERCENIVEFGPGSGDLGVGAVKESIKIGNKITWCAVEKNKAFIDKIKKRFLKEKLIGNFNGVFNSIDDLEFKKKTAVVFSYSLDSIAPEIFVNTMPQKSFPNGLIGITVKNSILEEKILTDELLNKKGASIKRGIYKDKNGNLFDLKEWMLFRGQKAFLPIEAFISFLDFFNKAPNNTIFLIIDEFYGEVFPWETDHLGLPKRLYLYKREVNLEDLYKEAGEELLYFPLFLKTFQNFISGLNISGLKIENEKKLAMELTKENKKLKTALLNTAAFIFKKQAGNKSKTFKLCFPILDNQ